MLVIEQWLAGRDFAQQDPTAAQMVNFVYLIADDETRKAWLVDPAWNVTHLYGLVERRGFTLEGALVTHWHPDHAGGNLYGLSVEGVATLHEKWGTRIHTHREELPWLKESAGLRETSLTPFGSGDVLELGLVRARCLHAPGHTPGSTCFLVWEESADVTRPWALFTGDTLFVGSCGRIDLPGSDPAEMFRTLNQRLAELPADTVVYPGHDYGSAPVSTLAQERQSNPYLAISSLEDWLSQMA